MKFSWILVISYLFLLSGCFAGNGNVDIKMADYSKQKVKPLIIKSTVETLMPGETTQFYAEKGNGDYVFASLNGYTMNTLTGVYTVPTDIVKTTDRILVADSNNRSGSGAINIRNFLPVEKRTMLSDASIDPDGNLFYLDNNSHGSVWKVMKSTDMGLHWILIDEYLNLAAGQVRTEVASISFNYNDPNNKYVFVAGYSFGSTNNVVIRRSLNGGSWATIKEFSYDNSTYIVPTEINMISLADNTFFLFFAYQDSDTNDGYFNLYISPDFGLTLNPIIIPRAQSLLYNGGIPSIYGHKNEIYYGFRDYPNGDTFYKSSDYGSTWTKIFNIKNNISSSAFGSISNFKILDSKITGNTIMIASYGGDTFIGHYRSDDNGGTWTRTFNDYSLRFFENSRGDLYSLSAVQNKLFKSIDQGLNWYLVSTTKSCTLLHPKTDTLYCEKVPSDPNYSYILNTIY
jgi:hypothetical protein